MIQKVITVITAIMIIKALVMITLIKAMIENMFYSIKLL